MKKATALFIAIVLTFGLLSMTGAVQKVWNKRRTLIVTEKMGISRKSYSVDVTLSRADLADEAADLRIADENGVFQSHQIVSLRNDIVMFRLSVDLPPKGKRTYYIYHGNSEAQAPTRTYVGVENFLGQEFVTLAWGEVRISSYTKDNKITITDADGKTINDIFGKRITIETYQAGGSRHFILKNPTLLKIKSTGLSSVAVGNFNKGENDVTAFIAGEALVYVPSFMALTSLRENNKVQVLYYGQVKKELVLGVNQTVVFDGLPSGFRKIVADYDCVIQYGNLSSGALFSVPQRGLVYSFLPIGPITIVSSEKDTTVDIAWSDPAKPHQSYTLRNPRERIELTEISPLEPNKEIYQATTITSNKPITVLAWGGKDTRGATLLPGTDGRYLSSSFSTTTGPIDPKKVGGRSVSLVIPTPKAILSPLKNENDFTPFGELKDSPLPMLSSTSAFIAYSPVALKVSRTALLLEGSVEDKSILFQVPCVRDETVTATLSDAQTKEGGWSPETGGNDDNTQPTTTDENESQFMSFIRDLGRSITNPGKYPLHFTVFILGILAMIALLAGLLWKRGSKEDEPPEPPKREPVKCEPPIHIMPQPETTPEPTKESEVETPNFATPELETSEHDSKPEPIKPYEKSKIYEPPPGKSPRLKPPDLSRFLVKDEYIAHVQEVVEKEDTKDFELPPIKEEVEPSQYIGHKIPEPEPPPPKLEMTETEIARPPSISKEVNDMAEEMCRVILVADPGAIMRLYKQGLLNLFPKIYISHTAATLLPPEFASNPTFERVPILGKDAVRAEKLASDLGVFEEVGSALVVAEKVKAGYYLTTANLPAIMGKLKVVHVSYFC